MSTEMQNIDIRNFTTVSSVELYDHVVLSLFEGQSAKMTVSLLRSVLTRGITPSIDGDGVWNIGESSTGVTAEGKTPEFRKGTAGIEYKYSTESDTQWKTLVAFSDLRLKYEDLTEEQIAALKLSFDDLTEEDIALLQSPAVDMIAQLEATDSQVKANEDARKAAETARKDAESARESAEEARVAAETSREEAENVRKENESARISNENARKGAESARISSENARVASENARATAEQSREEAEETREAAESERQAGENARQTQEQSRQASEAVRKASEETRISNEGTRQSNEAARENAETARNTAELSREQAEQARTEEYAALKEDILEATGNANDAAAESRNTPVIRNGTWWIWSVEQGDYIDTATPATSKSPQIQNGTWWTWDDDGGTYVDTGQPVSTDYVLTKEKIEGVFQGDIESHRHDRYVDKEEGKGLSTEDFTTEEKEKLAGLENFDPTEVNQRISELEEAMPTKVSELENDAEYVTASELAEKGYATAESLSTGLGAKQDRNLYFTDVTASEWYLEGVYKDFKYRCDIALEGVTADMVAEVIFGMDEASGGDYAPLCETGEGTLTIWGATNKAIVIPTVIVNR